MSPSTTTSAFLSAARIWSTKSFTTCACWWRCVSVGLDGGWKRPKSGWSSPFELKWLTITKYVLPRYDGNSPASGLRLVAQAAFSGSIRPGLTASCVLVVLADDTVRRS